jgi:hypothetical protein
MLDISALNAYVTWILLHNEWKLNYKHRRKLFIRELGYQLVRPLISARSLIPDIALQPKVLNAMVAVGVTPCKRVRQEEDQGSSGSRKSCYLCTKERRIFQCCNICGRNTCKEHSNVVCLTFS